MPFLLPTSLPPPPVAGPGAGAADLPGAADAALRGPAPGAGPLRRGGVPLGGQYGPEPGDGGRRRAERASASDGPPQPRWR